MVLVDWHFLECDESDGGSRGPHRAGAHLWLVDCWGNGVYGVLGDGSGSDPASPVQVEGVGGSGTLSGSWVRHGPAAIVRAPGSIQRGGLLG